MAQQAAQRLDRVISLKYQREEYRLGDDSGMSNLLMPGISYSYLRSDNRIDPHHGYHLQFDSKVAKEGLGSDTNLLYGTAMIKGLTTLWDNHRFLARAQVGGSATNGYKSVPPSLRFFAGGDQSVRGYDYQTLSPENDQGDRIGGRYMVALSAEYQYSIAEKWRIATFIDQGNSFNTLEMPSLKTGVGVGMRWVSPVGPIRLDLAHAWKIRAAFDCTFPWGLSCDAWFENRGLAVAAVLALVVLGLWTLLGTPAGSRWVLGQVPGLSVENFQGRLGGGWSADHLLWQQDSSRVELTAPAVDWSPACLLRMTLCINRLDVEQVSLQFPPGTEDSGGPIQLPDLKLPLSIQLGDVRVGSLLFNGSEELKGLQLAAHWTAAGMQIDSVRLERDALVLDLAGLLQPTGDWPLTASGNLSLPYAPGGAPWTVALKVDGDLLKTLKLDADSRGYLPARLSGELQPLADNLPAELRITADSFKPSADLPDTLQLNQLDLTAKGDLKNGYQVLGKAVLPAQKGPVDLLLQGKVDARGAQIAGLELTAGDRQSLRLSAELDWQQGFSAEAKIAWLDFPWHRLYPVIDEPRWFCVLSTARSPYKDGNYLGNLKADLDGPAGKFNVVTPFSGDLKQIFLPELKLSAGQGKAEGHLNLQFADGIAWDTALDLSALNPAYWVAELPGTLAGPLRSKGEFKNEQLKLSADLDLKGRLRGQTAVLAAKAEGAGAQWTLANLDMRLGDNRINGSGSLQQRLAGQIDIKLARLAQFGRSCVGRSTVGSMWPAA
jgi:autotransporter translocation and assembly factor TamB